jgi:hypothetical protein
MIWQRVLEEQDECFRQRFNGFEVGQARTQKLVAAPINE